MTDALQIQKESALLLANKGLISLARATETLVRRARLRTAIGAVELLRVADYSDDWRRAYAERIRICVEKMDLYRELFPREYAASQSPPFSTAREHEFYRLVNLRMFPVELSQIERHPEFFWPSIPLRSKQPHDWESASFEHLETMYRLALILCEHRRPGKWRTFGLDREPALRLGREAWSLFVYSCRVAETPLKFFPLAFYLMHYETGNPWFDISGDGLSNLEWNGQNIAKLFIYRTQASQLLANIDVCNQWLDESPEHARHVVRLWNEAAKQEVNQ